MKTNQIVSKDKKKITKDTFKAAIKASKVKDLGGGGSRQGCVA